MQLFHRLLYGFAEISIGILQENRPPARLLPPNLLKTRARRNGLQIAIPIAPVMFRLPAGGPG